MSLSLRGEHGKPAARCRHASCASQSWQAARRHDHNSAAGPQCQLREGGEGREGLGDDHTPVAVVLNRQHKTLQVAKAQQHGANKLHRGWQAKRNIKHDAYKTARHIEVSWQVQGGPSR